MINKTTKRLLSSTLGAALIAGIIQIPVFAADNTQASLSNIINSSLIGSNNSVEQNGVKITLNNVVGTQRKLQATITIQSPTAFDKKAERQADVLLTYGGNKYNNQSMSYKYPDEKTLVITVTRKFDNSVLPEKGPLRIDVVMQKYNVNIGLDTNVDFSESMKNSIKKDFSIKIPQSDSTLTTLESDVLGTQLTFTEPKKTSSMRDNYTFNENSFILKVGDKMYLLGHSHGMSSNSDKNDTLMTTTYESKSATYDKINNQTAMSLIPITYTINLNDTKTSSKEKNTKLETISNVSYPKTFDFSDGSKGEVYNIQRDDNSVKVYLKGANEKESLLMASTMFLFYKADDDKKDSNYYDDYYDGNESAILSKDPNDSLGYIVEFSNVKKDKNAQLGCEVTVNPANGITIGDEIKLSK